MAFEYKAKTAHDVARTVGARETDEEKALAEKHGVRDAAFVDYDEALKNYESRSDVETLEARLARENGRSFAEANFVREAGKDDAGVIDTKSTGRHAKKEEA